jgi:hypothetical protein
VNYKTTKSELSCIFVLEVLDLCFSVCSVVELYSLCIYEALEEIVMSYNESIKKLTIFSFFLFIRERISSCPCTLDPDFLKLFLRML